MRGLSEEIMTGCRLDMAVVWIWLSSVRRRELQEFNAALIPRAEGLSD